jgi:spore photoproduct lyase
MTRQWKPKLVLVTASAQQEEHGRAIVARCEAAGVGDIQQLPGDRLPSLRGDTERETYATAKSTLAVVTSSASKRRLQRIPPSADWSFSLAEGCPAHCQYCYLAGSLSGPPVTRVYADLPRILADLDDYVGHGDVTTGSTDRGDEGTTFEASCYTDPLGIEHLTRSLARTIEHFGTHDFGGLVQLRFTTKYNAVEPLLTLPHGRRTRARFSVNADDIATRYEGGVAPMPARLSALQRMAEAGYPVGLTIPPIMPVEDWPLAYGKLLDDVATALDGVADVDLTVECITHRFTPRSKDVLLDWYPRTKLEMDEDLRTIKRGKYGSVKHVYPRDVMRELRTWFEQELSKRLPDAKLLYWT